MSADKGNNGERGKPADAERKAPRISDTLSKPKVKRFYKEASVSANAPYQILVDGRPIRTPKKRQLASPSRALAEAIAAEWQAQSAEINPATMPLTRFANTAIDAVADAAPEVAADIVAYAGNDLLCYRAENPQELVERQSECWDPPLAWAAEALGAHMHVVTGIMPAEQSASALDHIARALEPYGPFELTGLHVLTTLTGSAILALAHARGWLSAEDAWSAAHVDEDYQISLWGEDFEASARRHARRADFDAASRFLQLLR